MVSLRKLQTSLRVVSSLSFLMLLAGCVEDLPEVEGNYFCLGASGQQLWHCDEHCQPTTFYANLPPVPYGGHFTQLNNRLNGIGVMGSINPVIVRVTGRNAKGEIFLSSEAWWKLGDIPMLTKSYVSADAVDDDGDGIADRLVQDLSRTNWATLHPFGRDCIHCAKFTEPAEFRNDHEIDEILTAYGRSIIDYPLNFQVALGEPYCDGLPLAWACLKWPMDVGVTIHFESFTMNGTDLQEGIQMTLGDIDVMVGDWEGPQHPHLNEGHVDICTPLGCDSKRFRASTSLNLTATVRQQGSFLILVDALFEVGPITGDVYNNVPGEFEQIVFDIVDDKIDVEVEPMIEQTIEGILTEIFQGFHWN